MKKSAEKIEGPPPRVLLLDDSLLDRELAVARLEQQFADVVIEAVGSEGAFDAALRFRLFDLVISDVHMPTFDGIAALELSKVLAPLTPVIFLSGATAEETVADLLRLGATDFVSKNRPERLGLAVARAINEARSKNQLQEARSLQQQSDAFVEGVLDSLRGHAVIGTDAAGDVVEWNRAAVLMFGYAREEAVGCSISQFYDDDDVEAFAETSRAAMNLGTAVDSRWMRRSDGTLFRTDGVLTALRDSAGDLTGFIQLVRDTTASHEAAVALRTAREVAERANRAKDRFLAVLSHELRAPLAPIATAAAVLDATAELPDKQRGLVKMITRNVALQARLIDDLFDLSAVSSGKLSLTREIVDMRTLAASTLDMVSASAEEKQLSMGFDWRGVKRFVEGDATRLQQILWNLLRNAVKFTPAGGKVSLIAEEIEGCIRVRCEDNGIGIPSDALKVIFDPFAQADENVARRYGGLGLGLAIAKNLAEMHGGKLEALSAGLGSGACFDLTLPLTEAPAVIGLADLGDAWRPDGKAVLLVEDEQDAADAMVMALELSGFRVTHARSLKEAKSAVELGRFDAVLSDLGLPDGSGLQVPRIAGPAVPAIALSGFGGDAVEAESKAAGFRTHLVKPASADTVVASLRAALR